MVVPTFNTIKSSNPSISSSITTYKLVDYFEIPGRTRGSIVTPITSIDLSNVQIIEGIVPMLNTSVVTTVKFASSGTVITGTDVFRGGKLTLINLDKVEEIGPGAFFSAVLTDTDIKLPSLELIGSDAFRESNVSTVEINTEIIADNAFRDCTNLTKVVLGDRVTELSHGSFQDDGNLSNINFNNVRTLGNYTFSGCTLFNIDISDTKLISIGDAAFMDTISYFGKLTIPVGVTSLGWRTFYNSAIDTVDMRNVETIGSETFSECKNLVRIDFGKVKTIDYRAFYNDKKVTNVSFSDSVFFVGTQAFSDCSINTLNLNKVERVSYEAFARNKLTELYLPKYFTFQMDSNLFTENQITKVTVAYDTLSSNNTINFRTMLGSNYTTLTDLVLEAPYGKDEEAVVSNHFGGVHRDYSYMNYSSFAGLDINYVRANNFKNILRHGYFYGLPSLVNVKVKEGYEFLGSESFFIEGAYSGGGDRSNYKLTNVELPDGLKGLGSGIFSGTLVNENVRINLPDSLEYIGYQSFFYCIGVTNSVDLPNLKYLQTHAFQYSGISKMYFRDKLVSVGEQTIFKCPNLKTIVFDVDIYAISPQNDHNFFSHIWMDHVYDLVEFTEKVQAEPAGADYEYSPGATFLYRLRAKKLIFHPDIPWKTLGKSFLQEAKVDYITLPQHLEKISSTAFYKADINSGNVVQIPDTITYIGDDAFHDAKIKINQLPANLQRIGRAAFYNCDFHSDPVIPESVTKIGGSSFMSDPGKGIHRNSFTINANIPASVTENNTVRQLMFNTAVDYLYFGPKVVELPSLTTRDTEFYQMPIKTATFEGLEVLPSKAFQECKDLVTVDFSKDENLNKISSLSFYKLKV